MEYHGRFYFVLPILVYWHNFPTLGNARFHWKTVGIFILFYQRWYIVMIFQYWEVLLVIGKPLEYLFCFTDVGILYQSPNIEKYCYLLENYWNSYFSLPTMVY